MVNGQGSLSVRVDNGDKLIFSNTNNHTMTGSLNISGSITSSSDRVLKSDITDVPIEEVKQLLSNISPKEYTRTDTNTQRIGFIANDFDEHVPDTWRDSIVGTAMINQTTDEEGNTTGGEEIKTLDYSRLTAVLWKVCQDLQARVEALEGNAI